MKILEFFRKKKNDGGVCNCKDKVVELKSEEYVYEHAPLEDGGHTSFTIMFCKKCNGLSCMPHYNFELFMEKGLYNNVENFRRRFNITKKYKE